MLKECELKELRKLKIIYGATGQFHALPYGKSKGTGLTELQFA